MTARTKRYLRLLGPTRVEFLQTDHNKTEKFNSNGMPRFRSKRTVGLLGYLAAVRRPISRDHLTAMFWPDEEASRGRANLRRELHNLTQILPGCWEMDHQAVAFIPSVDTAVDIYRLTELEVDGHWTEAAELLGSEFLEGLYLESNPVFDHWLLAERERWRGRTEEILTNVIERQIRRGRYSDAIHDCRHLLQVAPWNEKIHRQLMRLLAWTGQRGAALHHFENCKRVLWEELSVDPTNETVSLYQQILEGKLDVPPQLPAFLLDEEARHAIDPPLFVARELELAQIEEYLKSALAGRGRVIFISGGPGRGKTALMDTFSRQAMAMHPNLLVANGSGNASAGGGDPYLPFRDLMAMLSGDVESKWDAGAITRDHARRIWTALPIIVQALLEYGPHMLDSLISSRALLSRVTITEHIDSSHIQQLRELIKRRETRIEGILEQRYLFQQVSDVLHRIAEEQPLLLILDDLQWADAASSDLLFYLGRRIADMSSRILILCAYRPEEIAVVHNGERHPLAKTLSELKRTFGNVRVELGSKMGPEGYEFIDTLLNTGPYQLSQDFRDALYKRTEGHPLFTIELLHAMQERGDLIVNEHGHWCEGTTLDWEILPARVEAVIKERIDRVSPELQEILTIASVEGEIFTAQVVAEVLNASKGSVLHKLSVELERQHRLLSEREEVNTRQGWLSRFRFGHVLFQEYIYTNIGTGELRLLHREVAAALEKLYDGQQEEMAVKLSHHYHKAGEYYQAFSYFTIAAERAVRVHANEEAIRHYTQAIEIADKVSLDTITRSKLHRGRGLVCQMLGNFDEARMDLEYALNISHATQDLQGEWRLLLDLGKLWASRDYNRTRKYFEEALWLSQKMKDSALLAGSLNWMGNWYANDEHPVKAAEYHLEALEIFEDSGDKQGVAKTLDLLGIAHLLGANHSLSVRYYDQAIALFRELDDLPRLVSSLMGRGTTISLKILLATAPAHVPPDALHDIHEAIQIAQEIHLHPDEAWANWSLGLLYTVLGQFGHALEVIQSGLQIATELGHREWQVGNRFALGILYMEQFAPAEARQQLETALSLTAGLQSQYWIHHVIGALAGAHILQADLKGAKSCLEPAVSPETSMDTMGKRYCWVRQAELALARGDPERSMEITERLIETAPGTSAGDVITFLWMLKGNALSMTGQAEEAVPYLIAARENANALGEQFLLWRTHASLGRVYDALNRDKKAKEEYSTAQELIKELANGITDSVLKDRFLDGANNTLVRI